jgi:hypothetical protein
MARVLGEWPGYDGRTMRRGRTLRAAAGARPAGRRGSRSCERRPSSQTAAQTTVLTAATCPPARAYGWLAAGV